MKKKLTILVLVLVAALGAKAQVKATIDSASILLGDQAVLTVSGTRQYPSKDELTQNSIVALEQWMDTVNGVERQHTRLTSFEPGEHYLKVTPDDSLLLTVRDVANVDTASHDIKDIADILNEPYTFWEIFRWVLLAIIVAGLIIGIRFLVRYIRKRRAANQPLLQLSREPRKPADQRALESLESLRQRQLWQQGKLKEYHTELTDILRSFLQESYGINSTEMTSDQTLEAFESSKVCCTDNEAMLRQILQTADMVKFAKSEPLPYEHDRSMTDAKAFVASCKEHEPKPQPDDRKSEGKEPSNSESQS